MGLREKTLIMKPRTRRLIAGSILLFNIIQYYAIFRSTTVSIIGRTYNFTSPTKNRKIIKFKYCIQWIVIKITN